MCVPTGALFGSTEPGGDGPLESRHPCNEGISISGSFYTGVKGGRGSVLRSGRNGTRSSLQVKSASMESFPLARSQASAWVS